MENWRYVEGYEGLYQVSNTGKVKSLNYGGTGKEKLLKPKKARGYLIVGLRREGKQKWYKVHRLVYEAFNGTIPEGFEVNHIDENKENNSLENLNLMTPTENINYGSRNERVAKSLSKQVIGKDEKGNILFTFPSTQEAGRNGFDQGHIVACCNGKLNKHRGLYWNYA